MPRKKTESCGDVFVEKPPHNLFSASRISALNSVKAFLQNVEQEFNWIEEILAESKKTFSENNLSLLPKTPSAKRTRKKTHRCVADADVFEDEPPRKRSKSVCDSDDEVILNTPPQRTYRTRAASRVNSTKPRQSARTNKRGGRKATNSTTEREESVPSPVLSIANIKGSNPKDVSSNKDSATPTNVAKLVHITASPGQNAKSHYFSPPTVKPVRGHVKNKVTAYEDYIDAISPSSSQTSQSQTSVHSDERREDIPETPEHTVNTPVTPSTILQKSKISSSETCEETPTSEIVRDKSNCARKSIRRSIRKSLKCTHSTNKLNRKSLIQAVKHKLSTSKTENIQTPTKKTKTRLRLKKKNKENMAASTSEDSTTPSKSKQSTQSSPLRQSSTSVPSDHTTDSTNTEEIIPNSPTTHTVEKPESTHETDSHTGEAMETGDASEIQKCSAGELFSEDEKSSKQLQSNTVPSEHNKDVINIDDDDDDIILIKDDDNEEVFQRETSQTETSTVSKETDIKAEQISRSTDNEAKTEIITSERNAKCEAASSSENESDTQRTSQTCTRQTDQLSGKSASESEKEEQPVRQSTRTKQRKPQKNSSALSETENESQPVRQSTRTKTRKKKSVPSSSSTRSESSDRESADPEPIRRSTRTKQRKNTGTVSSVTESEDDICDRDSGHYSLGQSKQKPRSTRSKMRKPSENPSVGSDNSEAEEVFVVPANPPPKSTRTKTRKRQIDESSDTEAETSMSKRCRNSDQDEAALSQDEMDKGTPQSSDAEMLTEEESGQSDTDTPEKCPANKIVRPMAASFLHNLNSKVVRPSNLVVGAVKSFLHKSTPPQKFNIKEQQEQKKKELFEKQKKEKERLQKRDQMLKLRIEEQRRKREERMQKAADMREQREREAKELKEKLAKKMEVKSKQADDLKEEKLKEDQEKQRIRLKKIQEAEERRKNEEEEKIRKQKAQEEEEQRIKELMQRKKEFEEDERQKKIIEERKRQEERLAELEKERLAEKERLRKMEEERERERQRIREEREKAFARERAEREKQEAERKRLKDIELKMRIERLKELEKKRLQEEERRRQELKEREKCIKQIFNKQYVMSSSSNTTSNNTSNTKYSALPRPNLNTTQTLEQNPDSYEITPAKKYKTPSVDNYDISDLRSDDSTDEDDVPKKRVPTWASGPNLKAALINQYYHPPDLTDLFDPIQPPDLNELFVKKKARFNKRTSSAHWDSPILKPLKPGTVCH